jgi:hypothetical protein
VASAESDTTACIICSEIFDEDWISTRIGYNVFLVVVGLMKTALILREICYTTNVISAKDIKIYDD